MENSKSTTAGYLYALQAFLTWGVLPLFWKLLDQISAFEVLAHRIFWSFIFLAIWMFWNKQKAISGLLLQKKTRNSLLLSSLLICSNWGLFIYSVNTGKIVEASLGYYINPIVNVLLGMLVLHEKLDSLKFTALLLAFAAVVYLTVDYGTFPWISLYLAVSFGLYGLVKKTAGIEAISALAVETLLLTPFAAAYIIYKIWMGTGALPTSSLSLPFYLIMTGVVTTLPLYWFAKGAQRIPLSAVGFMQYIAPSLMLTIGVVIYKEEFKHEQAIAFGLIWFALILYTVSMLRNTRKKLNSNKLSSKPH